MVPIVNALAFFNGLSPYHLLLLLLVLVVLLLLRSGLLLGRGLPALLMQLVIVYAAGAVTLVPVAGNALPAIGLAVVALLVSIWLALQGWRHCRRVWLTDPVQLLDEPRPSSLLVSLVFLLALAGAWFSMGAAGTWVAALAGFLAGISACVAGHVAGRWWSAGIGLWIIALGWALLFRAGGWPGAFGLVLASAFLLWMANFWHQQLRDGVPWTTAGRLIPWARAGSALLAAITTGVLLRSSPEWWPFGVTLGFALILSLLLFRDGWSGRHPTSAAAAWFLSGTVAMALCDWLGHAWTTDPALAATSAFAFGPLLLSIRRLGRHEPVTATANLLLLPLLAVVEFISTGISPMAFWGLVPLLILELLTNRPPAGALAETRAASSNL